MKRFYWEYVRTKGCYELADYIRMLLRLPSRLTTTQRCSNPRARVSRKKLHAHTIWPAWRVCGAYKRVLHHFTPGKSSSASSYIAARTVVDRCCRHRVVHVIDPILAFQKRASSSILHSLRCAFCARRNHFVSFIDKTTVRIVIIGSINSFSKHKNIKSKRLHFSFYLALACYKGWAARIYLFKDAYKVFKHVIHPMSSACVQYLQYTTNYVHVHTLLQT